MERLLKEQLTGSPELILKDNKLIMRYQHPCIDCAKRQGIRVFNLALDAQGKNGPDERENQLKEILNEKIENADPALTPAELSLIAIRAAEQCAGQDDPFIELKKQTNALGMKLYPEMKERLASSENPLYLACQLAACGNIIDLGIQDSFDIHSTIEKVLKEGFKRDQFEDFRRELNNKKKKQTIKMLYLCDNAGEIAFDRLFIEELKRQFSHLKITAVVNQKPVLNDATIEDARTVELDSVVPVIDNGSGELGTVLSSAPPEFLAIYHAADIILSKGQANYETLSHRSENIYFLLKAKCDVIANSLGVELYDAVMTRSPYEVTRSN